MFEREAATKDLRQALRDDILEKYQRAATAREQHLLRRQRKQILETCRRIAVVGASLHPKTGSHLSTEKLLAFGVEVAPVIPGCERYLGLPCYARLRDIRGDVDIVQVYPREGLDLMELAREAMEKGARVFWIEEGEAGREVKEALADGQVQVVEHESLEREYSRHFPFQEWGPARAGKASVAVEEVMTKNPVTARPTDCIKDAMDRMKKGHFRHLPVVDGRGNLVAMLSDRDIRLIRPSLAFVFPEDVEAQLWSTSVRQAAAFDPVVVRSDASLERAAELMLRWNVGGLPVVDEEGVLVGMITYADVLRHFIRRGE